MKTIREWSASFNSRIKDVFSGISAKVTQIKSQRKDAGDYSALNRSRILAKKKKEQAERRRITFMRRKSNVNRYLEKSGIMINSAQLSKKVFNFSLVLNLLITFYVLYRIAQYANRYSWGQIFLIMSALWLVFFFIMLFLIWLLLYLIMDIRIFNRKKGIDEVLPDYLELAASNISAGMTIDKALWYAVRPRFGVLAKEIETVAKSTMSGEDLNSALKKFTDKYDSNTLRRSINILVEGIDAGGEVGDLLVKIASNIKENQLMRREMATGVTNYSIFIGFATIFGAPMLLALAGELLTVLQGIIRDVSTPQTTSSAMMLSFSDVAISQSDFRIFAVVTLLVTSFFSAAIVSTINKGDVKSGMKYVPIFILSTLAIFFITSALLGTLMSSIF